MAYRLKPEAPLGSEMRRVAADQLELALADLHNLHVSATEKAHRARRRVKKLRALVRLLDPGVGSTAAAADRRLRVVKRLLGTMSDGQAVVDMLDRVKQKFPASLPNRTFQTLREGLLQVELRAARKARLSRALDAAIHLLEAERKHARLRILKKQGFAAVKSGLLRSVRRAEKARRAALHDPTTEHHHVWRRRAKELWLQIRLLQAECAGQLASLERSFERLDGLLGEYQNGALLRDVVVAEALVSRRQTDRCVRVIRQYQSDLLRGARTIAKQSRIKKPRRFVKRVERLWKKAHVKHGARRSQWPHAA